MGGDLGAAIAWARSDVRARWRSLIALGLIAGIAAGLALACLVGADRTGTALERLRDRTDSADAIVFPIQAGVFEPEWAQLAARPEVEELARWALVFGDLADVESPDGDLVFAPADDAFLQTVDRPVVVEGRMWDPAADDELVVAEGFARSEGVEVGDTVDFTPFTRADLDEQFLPTGAPPQGPRITLRVVGLIRTPLETLFVDDGFTVASPGLLRRHPEVVGLENAVVRLRDDPGAVAALQRHSDEDVGEGVPVLDLEALTRRVTTTTDVERTVLLLLAATIAAAGLVLAGQMIGRSASTIGIDARTLSAMGMTRGAIAAAATVAHVPAALVAALTCTAGAVALSTALPFGLAGDLDPDTGLRTDVVLVAVGSLVVALLVLAATAVAAWRAARPGAVAPSEEGGGLLGWIRARSSVVVGLGATMAFRAGRGRAGVPVRPALLGAVIGVLGVAAAATVDAGLDDALDHPERAGAVWDAIVVPGEEVAPGPGGAADLAEAVAELPDVASVTTVDRGLVSVGGVGVPAFATSGVGGAPPTSLTVVRGRAPAVPGELALGPASARVVGVGIGDAVDLGPTGSARVVGEVLFPTDVHAGFDEGAWLHPADFEASGASGSAGRFLGIEHVDDAPADRALAALTELVGASGGTAQPAALPPELANLRDVVPLPRWLAAFLALLALAALLHVLSTSARARARDFAVLRALGLTRRGTRTVVHVQGVAVAIAGIAVGLPLGIAAGRTGWRLVAERVPLREVGPVAALALVLLVPAALLLSQVLAVGPGRRLRRLRPAEVLRSE